MIQFPQHVRPARPTDAADLAYLINEAGEGLPYYFWSQQADHFDPWDYGTQRAARDDGDFSWRNAHVIEASGRVVAMLLAFRIQPIQLELAAVPELVRPLAELEQLAVGSFYINGLAVRPEQRGHGHGTELIALAHALALEQGCQQLSLQYFTNNARARSLYTRQGFAEVARRPMLEIASLPRFGESILHVRNADATIAGRFVGH